MLCQGIQTSLGNCKSIGTQCEVYDSAIPTRLWSEWYIYLSLGLSMLMINWEYFLSDLLH